MVTIYLASEKQQAPPLPTMTKDLLACTGTAIDTKDSKVSEALTTAASEIASAIATRGTCQKTALALSSEQQGALNTCNKAFQDASKKANEKARSVQKTVWTAYLSDLKTCSDTAKSTLIRIEDGGQNMTDAIK